jgi:CubicO group peptidase (beta-lactamase class C family)
MAAAGAEGGSAVTPVDDSAIVAELRPHVEAELERWNVHGVELAAVRGAEVVFAGGFGLRDAERGLPVTSATLFHHGSTTKAFTAVLAAALVDEGLLEWDRPLRDVWPDLRLRDPAAAERVTLADLLSHRSGLARHEWAWLANPSVPRAELTRRLRHLEPATDMRVAMEYCNLGYVAVGELIGVRTGSDWEQQLRARVLEPLGMLRTVTCAHAAAARGDHARPYGERNGEVLALEPRPIDAAAPAGQLFTCADDVARWLSFQLGDGRLDGRRILSADALARTHTIHVPADLPAPDPGVRFLGYALGWVAGTWYGRRMLWHSGGIDGYRTEVLLLPDDGVGVAASANHTHTTLLPAALTYHVAALLLGDEPRPWSAEMRERWEKEQAACRAEDPPAMVPGTTPSRPLADFAATYEHPGYGRLEVGLDGRDGLRVRLGELDLSAVHRHFDTWTVEYRPADAALDESWPLTFVTGPDGVVGAAALPLEEKVPPIRFEHAPAPREPAKARHDRDEIRWRGRLAELLGRVSAPGAVFAVMHGDTIVECAAGIANLDTGQPMTTDTLVPIASISKVYTATLVMQLVDEGLLDLDAPVVSYLPGFQVADPEATVRLTARHLLTHTGGIDGDKEESFGSGDDALERYVASCATLQQTHDVGVTHSYCNSGYAILGRLVEVLRGQTFDAVLRERLLAPIGATGSATLPEDLILRRVAAGHRAGEDGGPHVFPIWEGNRALTPAGGVVATARDLLSFARMHIDNGVADGGTVLSTGAARAMRTPQIALPNPYEGTTHWGLGWEILRTGGAATLVGHGGDLLAHHARFVCCPEERFAVVLLINGDGADAVADPLFREALAEIGASLPEPVVPPTTPPDVDLTAVAGTYATIAVEATLVPAGDHIDATFRVVSERIAEMLSEAERRQQFRFLPVTSSLYVTRLDADDPDWTPAVFGEANGRRYLYIGGRAMRAT